MHLLEGFPIEDARRPKLACAAGGRPNELLAARDYSHSDIITLYILIASKYAHASPQWWRPAWNKQVWRCQSLQYDAQRRTQ